MDRPRRQVSRESIPTTFLLLPQKPSSSIVLRLLNWLLPLQLLHLLVPLPTFPMFPRVSFLPHSILLHLSLVAPLLPFPLSRRSPSSSPFSVLNLPLPKKTFVENASAPSKNGSGSNKNFARWRRSLVVSVRRTWSLFSRSNRRLECFSEFAALASFVLSF